MRRFLLDGIIRPTEEAQLDQRAQAAATRPFSPSLDSRRPCSAVSS